MAKMKPISLTRYVIVVLLKAFSGIVIILLAAVLFFQFLINNGKIAPANAGETEAQEKIEQLKESQSFPTKLTPNFYNYIYFTKDGKVKSASLSGESLKRTIKQYRAKNERYPTAAYLSFPDGTYALFSWRYKAQFVNERLRKLFPNFEILFLIGVVFALILFYLLFAKRISKQLKERLVLVEQASQQIIQRNLDSTINTSAGIMEFDHVLHSMEKMREALKESLTQQWETQQQRKQEIAALTHDINTPLTVINGNAELLLEEELPIEQQRLIQNIHDSGLKTKQYIDLLQQVSNFDVIQEEKVPVLIETILEELTEILTPLAKGKGLILNVLLENHPLTIVSAPVMLMRALVNIGENAIRFTAAGSVTIRVREENQELSFIFQDNGHGFSPAAITHAKEMFWQQDHSRTSSGNYGIGLSIAERAANYHNGRLLLENTNAGGKVTFTLPIDK